MNCCVSRADQAHQQRGFKALLVSHSPKLWHFRAWFSQKVRESGPQLSILHFVFKRASRYRNPQPVMFKVREQMKRMKGVSRPLNDIVIIFFSSIRQALIPRISRCAKSILEWEAAGHTVHWMSSGWEKTEYTIRVLTARTCHSRAKFLARWRKWRMEPPFFF